MKPWYLVLADGGRARFFTLEWTEIPDLDGPPRLEEQADLVNPDALVPDRKRQDGGKAGRNRAVAGGPAHGYDDHRDRRKEMLRRFADRVADAVRAQVEALSPERVIVIAGPAMLGHLRHALPASALQGARRDEVTEDLSKLPLSQLQQGLIERGVLPEALRSVGGFRPRGQSGPS